MHFIRLCRNSALKTANVVDGWEVGGFFYRSSFPQDLGRTLKISIKDRVAARRSQLYIMIFFGVLLLSGTTIPLLTTRLSTSNS